VPPGPNARRGEVLRESARIRRADDVEVPSRLASRRGRGELQIAHCVEALGVVAGGGAARLVPLVEIGQLSREHGGLKGVQASRVAEQLVVVLAPLAVLAEGTHSLGDSLVARHETTRVAEGTQVLGRVEAEGRGIAGAAGPVAVADGAVRLTGILDDEESFGSSQLSDSSYVGELSEEMNWDDETRSRADDIGRDAHVEAVIGLGDVDRDRNSTGLRDRLPGGDEGLCRNHYTITRLDARGEEGKPQRIETTRRPHAELGPAVVPEIAFEGLHDRPIHEHPCLDDVRDGPKDFRPQRLVHVAEVHEGNPASRQKVTRSHGSDPSRSSTPRPHTGLDKVRGMSGGLREALQSRLSADGVPLQGERRFARTTTSDDIDARGLIEAFIVWLDGFGDRSHDPYDFWATLLGRKAKRLYYRRRILGSVAALPFVLLDTFVPGSRKFVSLPQRYPIADAHYAQGFFAWAEATGDLRAISRAEHFLVELDRSRSPGFEERCWGLPFDWESRVGTIAAGTPLITVVPYVYEAFEAGHEATGKQAYLDVMESIGRFAHDRIPVKELGGGSAAAAAYSPFDRTTVVNASSYRGYLLASAGRRFGRAEWTSEAARNVAFVLGSQRTDGSWPYAPTAGDEFIDNFHTCLVLKNLFKFWRATDRPDVLAAVRRGYGYYRRELLDEAMQPIPFAVQSRVSLHRRDLYDYAEGINLAVLLRDLEPDAEEVLQGLLRGLAGEMALPDGHFVTRRLLIGRNAVPYHRWAQSQVFHTLTQYCRGER
jgi:hypothetical protein